MKNPVSAPQAVGDHHHEDSWQPGPMPPGTWNWGGVVTKDDCFLFADFHGDHVIGYPGEKRIEAADVVQYSNCLEWPPRCKGVGGLSPDGKTDVQKAAEAGFRS